MSFEQFVAGDYLASLLGCGDAAAVAYLRLPSLHMLLLLDPLHGRIEVAARSRATSPGWDAYEPGRVVRTSVGDSMSHTGKWVAIAEGYIVAVDPE